MMHSKIWRNAKNVDTWSCEQVIPIDDQTDLNAIRCTFHIDCLDSPTTSIILAEAVNR
jgi:hypothetical protein